MSAGEALCAGRLALGHGGRPDGRHDNLAPSKPADSGRLATAGPRYGMIWLAERRYSSLSGQWARSPSARPTVPRGVAVRSRRCLKAAIAAAALTAGMAVEKT